MTDTDRPGDARENALRAADAHRTVAAEVESFLRRLPTVPGPEHVAEYATLLSREERTWAERQAAVDALGLTVPSIETQ